MTEPTAPAPRVTIRNQFDELVEDDGLKKTVEAAFSTAPAPEVDDWRQRQFDDAPDFAHIRTTTDPDAETHERFDPTAPAPEDKVQKVTLDKYKSTSAPKVTAEPLPADVLHDQISQLRVSAMNDDWETFDVVICEMCRTIGKPPPL